MVDSLLADHAALARSLMADEKAQVLCEKGEAFKAVTRYSSLPKTVAGVDAAANVNFGSLCVRSAALPEHPQGSVVCSFDLSSPEIQKAAQYFVLQGQHTEGLRDGFLPLEDIGTYDFENDPRCKRVELSFAPGNFTYEDKYPGANCGGTPSETPLLSDAELKILRSTYCN